MKRFRLAVLALLPLLLVAGCSDHPDTGIIDIRDIRAEATIHEINGVVYGLKPEGKAAVESWLADREATSAIRGQIWKHVRAGAEGEEPTLTLTYSGIDGAALEKEVPALLANAKETYEAKMAEHNAGLDKLKAERAEHQAKIDELSGSLKEYEAEVAKAQAAYDSVEAKLEAAKETYNKPFENVIAEMNALAKSKGLNVSYNQNIIGRFRNIDFSRHKNVPAECPPQKGLLAVDIREINNQCAYLEVPSELKKAGVTKEAEAILSKHFLAMHKADQELGSKGTWGKKATGLYAALSAAQDTMNARKKQAAEKFGITRSTLYTISENERRVNYLTGRIEDLDNEEYLDMFVLGGGFYGTESYNKAQSEYIDAIEKDLFAKHITRVGIIKLKDDNGVKDGVFEEVPSGLAALITMTDIVATNRGRKDVARVFNYVDMTDEALKDADAINVRVSPDSIKRRGRDTSAQKEDEDTLKFIRKQLQKA